MRRLRALAALLLALCLSMPAWAERHALLIGVSEVAALPRRLWLHGPDNDVTLMRDALRARGFAADRITVLAGPGTGAAEPPTRAAIDRAVAGLLGRVHRGDSVVLHFAGHGSQVPQRADAPDPEPDGLDEVFLTADTKAWDSRAARLPNAVLDDEIGAWIDALVDRGATVWAVFDTCHAAGMSRGGPQAARWRSVEAAELGVPARLPQRSAAAPRSRPAPLPRADGRVLAFAARAHEPTGEEWLPRGAGMLRARMHGVFSYAVVRAIEGGTDTAGALRRALQLRYAQEGRVAPVPQVLGDAGLRLP